MDKEITTPRDNTQSLKVYKSIRCTVILLESALDGRMLLASSGRTMSGVILAGRGVSAVLGRTVPVVGVAPVFTSVKLSVMICQLNCRETEPTFSSCRLHTTTTYTIQLAHTQLKSSAQQRLKQVDIQTETHCIT